MGNGPRWSRIALQVLAWFNLVSCLVGGVLLVFLDGAGMPHAWLNRTPFGSFVWPGLILALVVGGSQAFALLAQHRRLGLWRGLHAAAGLVMIGWVFIEVALLLVWSPLQGVYFATGTLQVALAVVALGAWPRPFLAADSER